MRVLVAGNCQAQGFAACLRNMLPHTSVSAYRISSPSRNDLSGFDRVFLQAPWKGSTDHAEARQTIAAAARGRLILWPSFIHYGFHPDLVFATSGDKPVSSPMSRYNSALCIFGWTHGLSQQETAALFCDAVFDFLGYYWYAAASTRGLVAEWAKYGIDAPALLSSWAGCFAYSVNHPKLFVLRDLAATLCRQNGLATCDAAEELSDDLSYGPVWPVYPEIGSRLGIAGGYELKLPVEVGQVAPVLSLEEFIDCSYAAYSTLSAPLNIGRADALDRLAVFLFGGKALRVCEPEPRPGDYAGELVCEEELLDRHRDV